MNRILLPILVSLAACSAPPMLPRTAVPPPLPPVREVPPNPPAATDDAATDQWLGREVDRLYGRTSPAPGAVPTAGAQDPMPGRAQPPASSGRTPTDEAATRDWLDRTIEARRAANPDVPPEPLYQTVEHTVYVDRPVYYYRRGYGRDDWRYGYRGGYDDYGAPVYYEERRRSSFPVNTAIGAGVGAIIGHQSGHRDRGAAIGAGIGLLLDLSR